MAANPHAGLPIRDDDASMERQQKELDGLVWSRPHVKHSWDKSTSGKIDALSPWRLVDDWTWTREPKRTDLVLN